MARMTFIPFVGVVSVVSIGVFALAACASSSGTIGVVGGAGSTAVSVAARTGGQSTGGQNAGGQSAGVQPTGAGPSTGAFTGTASGSPAGGEGWVLSAPSTVFGFAQVQPSATKLAKIKGLLTQSAGALGISGTQVVAVYNDVPHGLYLIFAGYNGSGFDPARLQASYQTLPTTTEDGAGDKVMINNVTIDPGPHGGAAGCNSVMGVSSVGTTEATTCSWMTTTTMGSISTYPNLEHPNVTAVGPDIMGKAMRELRDQVERRS